MGFFGRELYIKQEEGGRPELLGELWGVVSSGKQLLCCTLLPQLHGVQSFGPATGGKLGKLVIWWMGGDPPITETKNGFLEAK